MDFTSFDEVRDFLRLWYEELSTESTDRIEDLGSLGITGLTAGSIPFGGGSGTLSQDNDVLYWDNTLKVLELNTATDNVFIGKDVIGDGRNTGDENVIIGHSSGYYHTSASGNIYIGKEAGYGRATGDDNIIIGHGSGYNSNTADDCVLVGFESGYNLNGDKNVLIGYRAGYGETGGTTTHNSSVCIGYTAGYSLHQGKGNVFVGRSAGYFTDDGEYNTCIGWSAGSNITSGSSNVMIGHDMDAPLATADHQIKIGDSTNSLTVESTSLLNQDLTSDASPTFTGLTMVNAITEFSTDGTMGGNSNSALPTEAAVVTYVAAQITAEDLDFGGDTGTGSVDLDSQTFTIAGTDPIDTAALNQTLTISHKATSGNVHIPASGSSAQMLQYSSAGTAKWVTLSSHASIADGGAITIPHVTSTGSDHTYIDQSVISGANVTFGTIGSGIITVADGSSISLQEDITFTGATTENLIKMPNNLPVALDFTEAGNSYMHFVTTDGGEGITFSQNLSTSRAFDIKNFVSDTGFIFTMTDDISSGSMIEFKSSAGAELMSSSGELAWFKVEPKINQSGTAGYAAFKIDSTITATGSGNKFLMELQTSGSTQFSVSDTGIALCKTLTINSTNAYITMKRSGTTKSLIGSDNNGDFIIYDDDPGAYILKANSTTADFVGCNLITTGNVGVNQTTWGTNAAGVLAQGTGTAPTTSPADCFQMYSADIGGAAGEAGAHFRDELGLLTILGDGGLVLDKTTGKGIKVDTATPTFGWRDLQGDILVKTAGANDPDYNDYASTGIRRYQFKNTAVTEVFNNFHVPHDYVPGTEIHVHIHWSQTVIDTGGAAGVPGAAKWYFDANYSKGHDRGAFPAGVTTVFVTPTASGTIRKHLIAEVQLSTSGQIGGQDLEPDGILTVRTYRDSDDDTLDQRPWVHHVDIHYQSTNISTKQKAPDFYV